VKARDEINNPWLMFDLDCVKHSGEAEKLGPLKSPGQRRSKKTARDQRQVLFVRSFGDIYITRGL